MSSTTLTDLSVSRPAGSVLPVGLLGLRMSIATTGCAALQVGPEQNTVRRYR